MRSIGNSARRLPTRILCAAICTSLAFAPLAARANTDKGTIEIPGVYGFLPLNSGAYTMKGEAKDKNGRPIACEEWDWEAINPVGGSLNVIDKSLSWPVEKSMFSFRTGSAEGAARVEVKCRVKDRVVAEGVALVSTKRGEKQENRQAEAPQPAPAKAGGGGMGLGGLALLGLGVAAAAAAAGGAGGSSSGGSESGGSCSTGFYRCTPPNSNICCPNGTTIYCSNTNTCTNATSGNFGNVCGNQSAARGC